MYYLVGSQTNTLIMRHNNLFILATFILLLTVILGAFGAHGLKPYMVEGGSHTFQTGIKYQFYHGLVIFMLLILHLNSPIATLKRIVYFFLAGIICFSGSLYLLSVKTSLPDSLIQIIGPITPLGGLFFIAGWVLLLLHFIKMPGQ